MEGLPAADVRVLLGHAVPLLLASGFGILPDAHQPHLLQHAPFALLPRKVRAAHATWSIFTLIARPARN